MKKEQNRSGKAGHSFPSDESVAGMVRLDRRAEAAVEAKAAEDTAKFLSGVLASGKDQVQAERMAERFHEGQLRFLRYERMIADRIDLLGAPPVFRFPLKNLAKRLYARGRRSGWGVVGRMAEDVATDVLRGLPEAAGLSLLESAWTALNGKPQPATLQRLNAEVRRIVSVGSGAGRAALAGSR